MNKIQFFIPGDPQGKGRARSGTVKTKSGATKVVHYTPEKTRSYEALIRSIARAEMIESRFAPFSGAVRVEIMAYIGIPKRWPAWKIQAAREDKILPTVKPDYDNIAKTQDALNGICWKDDAYICQSTIWKTYALIPEQIGVSITIYQMNGAPANITKKSQINNFFGPVYSDEELGFK